MAEALLQMYETMTETAQQELYDFAAFLLTNPAKVQKKEKSNPLEEFCGVINDEDAAVMMSASDECRRIEPDEW